MDNNNNPNLKDVNNGIEMPAGLNYNTDNIHSLNIKYPDFNSEYGKPVTTQDIQMDKVSQPGYFPGTQVSTNELVGTLDMPEDVIDIAYPTKLFPQAPVMIAADSKNSIAQETGKDAVAEDIKRSKKSTNIKARIVARMYISGAIRFEDYYHVSGFYRTLQGQNINFSFSFNIDKYRDNFRQAFIDNKVDCFNDKLRTSDISRYLKMLIEKKTVKGISPDKTGFFVHNNIIYFASAELCELYNLPKKINKHFKLVPPFALDIISENFVNSINNHEDKLLFMLLNIIRIAGIYSSFFTVLGTAFCKIVVIKGDYNKISPYLQVYDRLIEKKKELSINMKSEKAVEL